MKQRIHIYDYDAGIIYLDDGREIPVEPGKYPSTQQALDDLADWAKRQDLIGQQDLIAAYI